MAARYQRIADFDAQIGAAVERLRKARRAGQDHHHRHRPHRPAVAAGRADPLRFRRAHPADRAPSGRPWTGNGQPRPGFGRRPGALGAEAGGPLSRWPGCRAATACRPGPTRPPTFVFSIQNRVGRCSSEPAPSATAATCSSATRRRARGCGTWRARATSTTRSPARAVSPSLGPNQTNPRAEVELYDLRTDPAQVRNLAADSGRVADVQRLAAALAAFNAMTPDLSVATTNELRDRYQPAGQTPVTAAAGAADGRRQGGDGGPDAGFGDPVAGSTTRTAGSSTAARWPCPRTASWKPRPAATASATAPPQPFDAKKK